MLSLRCSKMCTLFENSSFRDRRYEYKGLNKSWKGKLAEAKANGNSIKIQEAQVHNALLYYTSRELDQYHHKCAIWKMPSIIRMTCGVCGHMPVTHWIVFSN